MKSNDNKSSEKSKSLLSIIAIVLIIQLVGITLFTIFNGDSKTIKNNQSSLEKISKNKEDLNKTDLTTINEKPSEIVNNDIVINNERFIVLEKTEDLKTIIKDNPLVLVELRVSWCKYCKDLESRFPKLLEDIPGLKIVQVDIEKFYDLASYYQVTGTPSLIVYKNNEVFSNIAGAFSNDVLKEWIQTGDIKNNNSN